MENPAWKTYEFCPKCGKPNTIPLPKRTAPFRCTFCGYTQYFNPAIGLVGIVVDPDNNCLILTRKRLPKIGSFCLPGGFADFDETAEEGLRREIHEETGLTLDSVEYFHSETNDYGYAAILYKVLDFFYICRVQSFDSLTLQESEVASPYIGIPTPEHIEKMAFPSNRNALMKYYGMEE